MLSPCASLRVNSAKHLAAQRERSFAALRMTSLLRMTSDPRLLMTSDPRLFPILVGENHYRPGERVDGSLADKSAVCQYIVRLRGRRWGRAPPPFAYNYFMHPVTPDLLNKFLL